MGLVCLSVVSKLTLMTLTNLNYRRFYEADSFLFAYYVNKKRKFVLRKSLLMPSL